MKALKYLIVLSVFLLLLFGCSDKSSLSPLETEDGLQTSVNLDKKGPLVHSVEGAGLAFDVGYSEKNFGARYTAHQYADGSYDGEYLVNCALAAGDPTFKWNGTILKFKIYEDAGPYGGKMAVFLGQEKTGMYAGWYDVFYCIDNGKPGQQENPDQVNYIIVCLPSLEYVSSLGFTLEGLYNLPPDELISILGTMNCDKGNINIE